MTIPELGTIRATHPPIVVLTSNRTRDLHDALKRRCLYHWIDYPAPRARGRDRAPPGARRRRGAGRRRSPPRSRGCARSDAAEAARDRRGDRLGGGARACSASSASTPTRVDRTLGSVLKYREDQEVVRAAGLWRGAVAEPGARAGLRGRDGAARPARARGRARPAPARGRPAGRRPERAAELRPRARRWCRPMARRRLYWTARAVFVSDRAQVAGVRRRLRRGLRRPAPVGARPTPEPARTAAAAGRRRARRPRAAIAAPPRRRGRRRRRPGAARAPGGRRRRPRGRGPARDGQRRGAAGAARASPSSTPTSSRSSTG